MYERRIKSIDLFRVISITAVIVIHTTPFNASGTLQDRLDLATILNQLARFAVPFFFILSGFLWGRKVDAGEELVGTTLTMAKRVLFLFIAWSFIYLLPTNLFDSFEFGILGPIKKIAWNVHSAALRPWNTLLQGTKEHLWYLMGLLCSLSITAVLVSYGQRSLLVLIAVALYITGLAGSAYSSTPFGLHSQFNFRNGPFFSLIFFATGYFLQRKNSNANWFGYGLLLTLVGASMHLLEIQLLHSSWGVAMNQDYVASTYVFASGTAMMALSNSRILDFPCAAKIGPLVVGIYTAHMIFVDLFKPIDKQMGTNPIWSTAYVVVVFYLSYVLVKFLLKFNITRKLVS